MKNQNEEIQILSHDEEAHLNSNNNNSDQISYGNSHMHINNNIESTNKNIVGNLNIAQLKQNSNTNPAINQNMNYHRFHINPNSLRIRNADPNNQNQNYPRPFYPHQHQHHQNQHDFTNPKFLFYFVLGIIKMVNYRILKTFSGFTSTLDMYINKSKLNPYITRFIHSKQIIIIIYTLNIQYLFYSIQKISFLDILNKTTLKLFIFSVIGLIIHYCFYKHKLFVENDEELEKFVSKRNPEIKKGKCEYCNVIRVCRSIHCPFCNKCVKKYQLHSDWFNICIGGANELLYAVVLFFANLYYFMSTIIIWYYILVRSDLLNYLILIFSIFGIIGIYFLFNSLKFLYSFIFDHLLVNLTVYEKMNQRRLTYLWKGDQMNSFFNPFDKGLRRNIEEMFINLFDVNIYSQYKNLSCNNDLSEIIEDEKTEQPKDEFYVYNEFNAFKMMLKLTEHFDPFISNKGNIYKFVDGKEIINWNRLMIFTAFDIINCPFKESMVNRAKMMLKQREMYLQNMQKLNQNKIKNNNDENKNKENIEVIDKDEINNNENNKIEIENNNENNNEDKDNQENKENKEYKDNNDNSDNKEENENNRIDENNDNEKENL